MQLPLRSLKEKNKFNGLFSFKLRIALLKKGTLAYK